MPDDDAAVLVLPAEVDHRVVGGSYERAAALLGPGVTTLAVDLERTTFLDSAGIALLVRIKNLADVDGARVVLRRPSERVRRVLELAGMADYLPVEE